MLSTLVESRATPLRHRGGTLVSVGVHTALVGLAMAATARATYPRPVADPPRQLDIVYTPLPPVTTSRLPQPWPERWNISAPTVQTFLPPVVFTMPSMHVNNSLGNSDDFAVAHIDLVEPLTGTGRGSSGGSPDEVFTALAVEKAAVPRADNPAPLYPATLRSAAVEGFVVARFIVDTSGRAEPQSITFTAATHPLFADAVRHALLRSRYLPAVIGTRAVRQLVEQRFAFTLTR